MQLFVGHKGLANVPAAGLSVTVDTLNVASATPAVLSTVGASSFVLSGSGFDAQDCSRNRVAIDGLACAVTACNGTSLTATYPGDAGTDASAKISTSEAAAEAPVAVEVLAPDGSVGQSEEYASTLSTAEGGATVPFCALASTSVDATLGAHASVKFRCSDAAVAAGVRSLHAVPVDTVGLASDSTTAGAARRLLGISGKAKEVRRRRQDVGINGAPIQRAAGRRLLDTSPAVSDEESDGGPGLLEPLPCKVQRAPTKFDALDLKSRVLEQVLF